MTELDFDELDKAVNSLMTDSGAGNTVGAVADTPQAVTPPTQAVVAAPASSPATRRRGQFMDVMHPSSNMRQAAPAQVTHQAIDIAPLVVEDTTTSGDVSVTEDTHPTPSVDIMPEPTSEQTPVDTPVVATPVQPESVDTMIGEQFPLGETAMTSAEPSTSQDLIDNSLTSPFLPDTKVEKRPLGEPMPPVDLTLDNADASPELPAEVSGSSVEIPETDKDDADTDAMKPLLLPDELKGDVVAVEANEVMHEEPVEAPVISEPAPTPEISQPINGSIAQQYEEQPSTGDQTNGAIYDTDSYHQPLDDHPAKKKSSVLTWILWTFVLLIVGATAGAAWFYFTTQ